MATSSAVSNLERRLDVLEEQAAENQYNLVRNKLRMWKGCCFVRFVQLLKGFLCGSAFKMPWQPTMLINFELTSLERDH